MDAKAWQPGVVGTKFHGKCKLFIFSSTCTERVYRPGRRALRQVAAQEVLRLAREVHRALTGASFNRGTWGVSAPHGGSYAYAISNLAYGYLKSNTIMVTPGQEYDLYAWVRGELDAQDSEGSWMIEAYFRNSSGGFLSFVDVDRDFAGSLTTTWQQRGGRVTAPTGAATVEILLYNFNNSGWVAFDDVSFIRVGTGTNLVTNPGFEDSTGWVGQRSSYYPGTSFWRSTWGTAAPHSGSYAHTISNQAYGYLESSPVVISPSMQYDLRAYVRGEIDATGSEGNWIIRAVYYDGGGNYLSYQNAQSGGPGTINTTWQQKGGTVTTPANAATMRIRLYSYLTSGWVAFDDVSLSYQTNQVKYYYAGVTRVAMRTGAGTGTSGLNFLLSDHLGSTSVSTDGNGANPTTQLYKAWGEVRWSSASLPTRYTFTGQYSNMAEFGLMYFGARWLDPLLGRMAQADTIVPGAGNPMAWDRYAAMLNNPVRYTDPSGHFACEDEKGNCRVSEANWMRNYVPLTDNGKAVKALYEKFRTTDGWWNSDGDLTLEEFMGLWIIHESLNDPLKAGGIGITIAQGLYVGYIKDTDDAACASTSVCINGAFNLMGAKSQLGGGFLSMTPGDVSGYYGYGNVTRPGFDAAQAIMAKALDFGNAAFDTTTPILDKNNAPHNWGNSTPGTKGLRGSPYKISDGYHGSQIDSIYFMFDTFLIYTPNQANYWIPRGIPVTTVDQTP